MTSKVKIFNDVPLVSLIGGKVMIEHNRTCRLAKRVVITAFLFLFVLPFNSSLNAESSLPRVRLSVLPLDLSRAPSTEEIMAAGQLGGQLYPTEDIDLGRSPTMKAMAAFTPSDTKKIERNKAINLSFGEAIQKWNKHEYAEAVMLFKKHAEQYPDSPWASEAVLHVGCDATYHGRFSEAEESFNWILEKNRGKTHDGAKKLINKTKLRQASLKVFQNNFDEARGLFGELLQYSDDWRERTYASHWIQRLSRYSGNKLSMLNCGVLALAHVLERDGKKEEAREVSGLLPGSGMGHSMEDLRQIALNYDYDFVGLKLSAEEIVKTPLPAIIQISGGKEGDSGHYWVLEKTDGSLFEFFDPQAGRRYTQSISEFSREWDGNALVLQQRGASHQIGELMPDEQLRTYYGGCCGAPPPPTDQGDPGDGCPGCCHGPGCKKSKDEPERERDKKKGKDPCGAPVWSVNMISMNLFVTDTPLWFVNPVGPSLEITLSYNSQSSINHHEPFGNKWIFNYSSYLIVDTGGQVTVFMPDGRHDLFSPGGSGYVKPLGVFNTLTKIGGNHFQLKFPDGTVYEYDIPYGTTSLQPFLVKVIDRYGESLKISYKSDPDIRFDLITDALGRPTRFLYNAEGLVWRVVDPVGRSATFDYENSNLISITDMGGYSTSFTYDQNVYLTSIGNSRGTWAFYIEPSDNSGANSDNYPPPGDQMWQNSRITVTDPSGAKEEYMYYAGCDEDESWCAGRSWHVSPKDYVEWQSQTYNHLRLNVPKTRYFFTNVNGKRGRISSVRYPDGGRISYTYDPETGRPATIQDPHGHTTSYTYNAMGLKTSITDAKQKTTTMTYADNNIDLSGVTNALGSLIMTYDDFHNIKSLTDRMGKTTTFDYDAYGRIAFVTNPLGNVIHSTYYETSDPQKYQLKEITASGTTLYSFTYDYAGRVEARTDASGLTLTFEYDHLDRVTYITYPDGKHEAYVYSGCCPRLIDSYTGRSGLTTHYTYDALEHLVESRNPDDSVIRYEYDMNGNLIKLIDTNGNATTFSYDVMDRLTRKTYADGNYETYEYDWADLLTGRTNARGIATTYDYDQNHNLQAATYSDGTPGFNYAYDDYNRAKTRTDGIGTYTFAYDANSKIISIDGPWDNDTLTFSYDGIGRIETIQQQGGESINYTYDGLARLSGLSKGTEPFIYSYPPNTANPLPVSLTRPNGSITAYQPDTLKRLTRITNMKASREMINANEFTYNSLDLKGSETVTNGNPITSFSNNLVTYEYNNVNQLLSSSNPDRALLFDKDGNMTKGYTPEGYIFNAAYDAEDRLKSLDYTDGASVAHDVDYYYSGNGLLAKRVDDGVETRFVRNGYLVLQERDGTNSVTRSYLWGRSMGGGIGGLIELAQGGQRYNYLYDGKGNVSALIDSNQNVVAAYTYDAFGNLMTKTGTLDQPYKFSTKPYDEKAGLYYYGHRFYSPATRSWTTRDPLRERGGINLYGFVGNSPLNHVDPLGLESPAAPKPVVYSSPAEPGLWELFKLGVSSWFTRWFGSAEPVASACVDAIKDKGPDVIDVFTPKDVSGISGTATTVVGAGATVISGVATGLQAVQIIGEAQGRDLLGTGKKNPLGACEQAKDWGPVTGAFQRECGF